MNMLRQLWGANGPEDWLTALITLLVAMLVLFTARRILVSRLRRWASATSTCLDDILVAAIAATHGVAITAVGVYLGAQALSMPPRINVVFDKVLILVLMMQVGLWGQRAIRAWLEARVRRNEGSAATHLGILAFVLSVVLWAIVLLATLNNLGFDITALVASLGIGGVAVALAVQNILGDLFASLSIALDKPFLVGDFIIIDDMMGTVKHVGLKTTRVQSLSGEELIFANNDLLKSRIRNYKRMAERRVVFSFGVTYDTSPDMLEKLVPLTREIVSTQQKVRLDRVHFKSMGDWKLEFEVVYYVLDPDFNLYMDIQQAINLALMRKLQALGVAFAFPTQTVNIASFAAPPADEKAAS